MGFDYTTTSEDPPLTNANLLDGGAIESCDLDGYCQLLDTIQLEGITATPSPLCNTGNTGGNGLLGPWRCIGSNSLACGQADNNGDIVQICPVPEDALANTDICVLSIDEPEASDDCKDACLASKAEYLAKDLKSSNYTITEDIDCDVFDNQTMQWVQDVEAECAYGEVSPGFVSPSPISFTATLSTNSGGSASSAQRYGTLDYEVGTCSSGTCPITVHGIHLMPDSYSGVYAYPTGATEVYSISGLHAVLLRDTHGTVDESTGMVYFPQDSFDVSVSTGLISLGGASLVPVEDQQLTVTQVVGSLRGNTLTLNISYSTADASMSINLTTE